MKQQVFFLVTIDGDLRIGTPAQQASAVSAIRSVHRRHGLLGRTTWMINELDFHWTEQHPGLLLDLVETGESIGIHDHLETHHAFTYSQAKEYMYRSKSAVERLLRSHGSATPITMHRNGCGFQSETWYDAQRELGYQLVSDVWPEKLWSGGMLCDGALPNPWRSLFSAPAWRRWRRTVSNLAELIRDLGRADIPEAERFEANGELFRSFLDDIASPDQGGIGEALPYLLTNKDLTAKSAQLMTDRRTFRTEPSSEG